ncbi:MAG TPA: sigma factor [Streptosporangiaceae bacterium]
MNDVNAGARAWALGDEQTRTNQRFEDIVRAADAELRGQARAYACSKVGADDADDVVSTTWEKALIGFAASRGKFRTFFFTVLGNACSDVQRGKQRDDKKVSLFSREVALSGVLEQGEIVSPDPADDVIERFCDVQDKITAAIEVLGFTEKECGMLGLISDDERSDGPEEPGGIGANSRAADRQAKRRLRSRVDDLAGLTSDERRAASLVRTHHTVVAAAKAAPDLDVPGLLASAKRKVLALFGITTETED